MIEYLTEWAGLAFRWLHVTFAIAWIGHAFMFHELEHNLKRPEVDDVDPDVNGEMWMVHGGGFFRMQKTRVLPKVFTGDLKWFKYESLGTWVTGFFLLIATFYMGGGMMLTHPAAGISSSAAIGISLGTLIGGWAIYDTLWARIGGPVAATGTAAMFLAACIALPELLSGRAAFLHVGALMGTLMTANVWMRILPNSRKSIAALIAGQEPDPSLGAVAHQRSVHNGYMHFPIIFLMISNHYPALYGHDLKTPILLGFIALGVAVRQYVYDGIKAHPAIHITALASLGLLVTLTVPKTETPMPVVPVAEGLPTIDAATAGSVTGRIAFVGDVPPAEPLKMYGACAALQKGEVLSDAVLVTDGGLQNVFVSVTAGLEGYDPGPIPEAAVEVDQSSCIYDKRLFGVRVGQTVTFINSDDTFHNVRTVSTANEGFNLNMPAVNQREDKVFRMPEVTVNARCDVHPWMQTYLGVVPHNAWAISAADGQFEITGLPPGDYTIEAWHEVFGLQSSQVTVTAKGSTTADFAFKASE
ncbi:MAG: urate hydroxylase PuuD [Proteobacteria bacterium]|nr:urate hydroxylase PuuD [Pseudomonadota bacterium]